MPLTVTCPMCKKDLVEPTRTCPRCQANVSLLIDLVSDVSNLLAKADSHRRSGDLAAAVETYLHVLDIDPTNLAARDAVGPVLLAVRSAARIPDPRAKPVSFVTVMLRLGAAGGALAAGYGLLRLLN